MTYSQVNITTTNLPFKHTASGFPSQFINISLPEDSPPGTSIYTPDSRWWYGWQDPPVFSISGNGASLLQLDPSSGQLQLAKDLTFDSSASRFSIVLVATINQRGIASVRSSCTIYISVNVVKRAPPRFTSEEYKFSASESLSGGSFVGKVDAGQGRFYSFTNLQHHQSFRIDPVSGEIFSRRALTATDYLLDVSARDSGFPIQTSRVRVLVSVKQDMNAAGGMNLFSVTNFTFNVRENSPPLTYVGILSDQASSKFMPSYSIQYFLFTRFNGSLPFIVDRYSGIIATSAILDREMQDSYKIQVKATLLSTQDSSEPLLTSLCEVIVKVVDVNDNRPRINKMAAIVTLPVEDQQTVEKNVVKVVASDADIDENGRITYEILKGNNII